MHEISFAKAILLNIDSVIDKSKEADEITLELGELIGIEEKHLIEHLKVVSNYNFKIINKPSNIRCTCGYEGPAKIMERMHDKVIWGCAHCSNPEELTTAIEGDKIKILKITYK